MMLCFLKDTNPLGCGSPRQSSVGYFIWFIPGYVSTLTGLFWFLPRFYPVQMAAQIITSQIIPIRNAKQCEQCRPLTTHDSQVKDA